MIILVIVILCFIPNISPKETPINSANTTDLKKISLTEVIGRLSRAYNNPYHPEDDLIADNSDDDEYKMEDFRSAKLSDYNDNNQNFASNKRLKINGKYYNVE